MITRDIIINDILIPSIKRLYQEDYDNIRLANENDTPRQSKSFESEIIQQLIILWIQQQNIQYSNIWHQDSN